MSYIRTGFSLLLCALVFASGCGRGPGAGSETVTVGSKNFTEQLVIAEIMAQAIEAGTNLKVARKLNLGGTMICHNALVQGDIDLYAEYTGTALTAILKKSVVSDPNKVLAIVSKEYAEQFQCGWQKPFGFNNTYAITVRGAFADEKGLEKVSDLAGIAGETTAGFTAEFMEREDGYPGLKKAYGISFKDTRDMEPSLMYRAMEQESVDVICAFATDGRIAAYKLRMLEDDKGFFPPYYAAPVVRQAALDKHPGIAEALAPLAGALDDETMQKLNFEVDDKKREPAEVAREFLVGKGIVKESP